MLCIAHAGMGEMYMYMYIHIVHEQWNNLGSDICTIKICTYMEMSEFANFVFVNNSSNKVRTYKYIHVTLTEAVMCVVVKENGRSCTHK